MKISALRNDQIKEFCGIDDASLLEVYKTAAKDFIRGQTGLTDREIDAYDDLTIAYMILINDMSFNRDYSVNRAEVNPAVDAILSMHARNLIG